MPSAEKCAGRLGITTRRNVRDRAQLESMQRTAAAHRHDGKIARIVAALHRDTPRTASAILATAIWTMPCADCAGIERSAGQSLASMPLTGGGAIKLHLTAE